MNSFIALYTMPWMVLLHCKWLVMHRCEGDIPIPMALRVFVQRSEHDRQDNFDIVADEVAKVFVVPEVERTFRDLCQISGNQEIQTGVHEPGNGDWPLT